MIKLLCGIFIILSFNANSIDLKKLKLGEGSSNKNQKIFTEIYMKYGGMPASIYQMEGGRYLSLWGNGKGVSSFYLDEKNHKPRGHTLPRWPEELKNKEVADMYQLRSDPNYAKEYSYRPFPSFDPNFKQPPVMGCLAETPLRYGDIDDNKTEELVLLLGHEDSVLDFVLFDPDKEKISFSARVIMLDIDDYHGDESKYQYTSNHNMSKGEYIGTQTFAKVFMGEFDGFESNKDIIVWRKHYQSRKKGSLTKGFELVSENYQFYTLKDGEYKLQISLESRIEQWMKEKNLTWQKGFPSKSECAGQESQLIPEMHDPLLNDPDVLK